MRRPKRYDIPVKVWIQIGDAEPRELGEAGMPYPYNPTTALPRLLRELADDLEESAHD